MAYTDDLTTALNNSTALLAQITLTPKPTYTIDGETWTWTEYQKFLLDHIEACTKLLAQGLPFEIVSPGR